MNTNRMKRGILTATILAIICVAGVIIRTGYQGKRNYLLALFYNRFLMGIIISMMINKKGIIVLIRGGILGFLVSLAFYLSTGFQDPIALVVGIAYGIIIDAVASKYTNIIIRLIKNLINNLKSEDDIGS
ncbi:MAG: hypothetical protein ACOCRX_09355 [Candidatus Woesearchaeota archaeon]